jgi:hypothetical protein
LIALSAATFLVLAGCAVDCSAVCQAGNRELAAIPIPPSDFLAGAEPPETLMPVRRAGRR